MENTDSNIVQKKLNKNIIIGVTGSILLRVISFVTIIIVGYIMSNEEYGNLSTFITWTTIFSVFVGFQFGGSLQNALMEHGEEKYHSYCSTLIVFSFFSFLIIFVPLIFINDSVASLLKFDSSFSYFLIPQCFFSFLVNFMSSYFLAQKKVKNNLIWTLIYCFSTAVLSLSLSAVFGYKELWYIIGMFIPNFIMGTLVILFFVIKTKFSFDVAYLKFALIFSLPLIMHTLGSVILGQSDKIMIRYMIDELQTGQYTMTHNYSMLLNSVWAAFNSVFIPFFYDNLKDNKTEELKTQCKNYYIFFTCISIGYILVGREIVKFIVDEKFYSGLDIFEVSVLAQFFIFLYSFCVNYEFFRKKTIWVAIGTGITALLNIGLNFWFIGLWGIFGAALASTISYMILIIFHELIVRFIIKDYPISVKYTILLILIGTTITIISILLRDFWYIRWSIGALVGLFLMIRIIKIKRII